MANFTQVDEDKRRAPMRAVAVLDLEPEDFTRRFELEFTNGPSNLGESCAALVQTTPGRQQYLLLRYLEDPEPGIEVLADEKLDPGEALRSFLVAFRIDDRAVTWALQAEHPVTTGP